LLTKENTAGGNGNHQAYYCDECAAENRINGRDKTQDRDYALRTKYGITINEYKAIFDYQEGTCWICGKPPVNRALSVDHKHLPGEKRRNPREIRVRVRGLLCWRCNNAIGKFDDNPLFLRKAADYLDSLPAQKILEKESDSKLLLEAGAASAEPCVDSRGGIS